MENRCSEIVSDCPFIFSWNLKTWFWCIAIWNGLRLVYKKNHFTLPIPYYPLCQQKFFKWFSFLIKEQQVSSWSFMTQIVEFWNCPPFLTTVIPMLWFFREKKTNVEGLFDKLWNKDNDLQSSYGTGHFCVPKIYINCTYSILTNKTSLLQ